MQKSTLMLVALFAIAVHKEIIASNRPTPHFMYGKIPGPLVPGTKNWEKLRQLEREEDYRTHTFRCLIYATQLQKLARQREEYLRNNPEQRRPGKGARFIAFESERAKKTGNPDMCAIQ